MNHQPDKHTKVQIIDQVSTENFSIIKKKEMFLLLLLSLSEFVSSIEQVPEFQQIPDISSDSLNFKPSNHIFNIVSNIVKNSNLPDQNVADSKQSYLLSFVHIEKSSFINLYDPQPGGAMLIITSQLVVADTYFEKCGSVSGGGCFVLYTDSIFISCNFSNCFSYLNGGGLSFSANSNADYSETLTQKINNGKTTNNEFHFTFLNKVSFKECHAREMCGGCVFNGIDDILIQSCEFIGCSTTKAGGALGFFSINLREDGKDQKLLNEKELNGYKINKNRINTKKSLKESDDSDNQDDNVYSPISIIDTLFEGNSVNPNLNRNNPLNTKNFRHNEASRNSNNKLKKGGGAIYVYNCELFFTNKCVFKSNSIINAEGRNNYNLAMKKGKDIFFTWGKDESIDIKNKKIKEIEDNTVTIYKSFSDSFDVCKEISIGSHDTKPNVKADVNDNGGELKFEGYLSTFTEAKCYAVKPTALFTPVEEEKNNQEFDVIEDNNINIIAQTPYPTEYPDMTTISPFIDVYSKFANDNPLTRIVRTMPLIPSPTHNLMSQSDFGSSRTTVSKSLTFIYSSSHIVSQTYSYSNVELNVPAYSADAPLYTNDGASVLYTVSYSYTKVGSYTGIFIQVLSETHIDIIIAFGDDSQEKTKKPLSSGMLIGIVCGGAAAVFIIAGAVVFIVRQKKNNEMDLDDEKSIEDYGRTGDGKDNSATKSVSLNMDYGFQKEDDMDLWMNE